MVFWAPLGVALAAAATPIILELALLREYRRYIQLALDSLATKSDVATLQWMLERKCHFA